MGTMKVPLQRRPDRSQERTLAENGGEPHNAVFIFGSFLRARVLQAHAQRVDSVMSGEIRHCRRGRNDDGVFVVPLG